MATYVFFLIGAFSLYVRDRRRHPQAQRRQTSEGGLKRQAHSKFFSRTREQVPTLEKINVLTFSDRVTEGLCASMYTAAMNGFELRVFGVERDSSLGSFRGDPKMRSVLGMHELLANRTLLKQLGINEEGTLIFADASDVIYLGSLDEAQRRFQSLAAKHGKDTVLFAAERNCWPYMDGVKEMMSGGRLKCADFQFESSTFRYINSGAYMGRVKAVQNMLTAAFSRIDTQSVTQDDQNTFHELYTQQLLSSSNSSEGFNMVLDRESEVFQTGWGTHLEGEKYAHDEKRGAFFDLQSNRVLNTEHDSKPFLVHFNRGNTALFSIIKSLLDREMADGTHKMRIVLSAYESRYSWFSECTVLDLVPSPQVASGKPNEENLLESRVGGHHPARYQRLRRSGAHVLEQRAVRRKEMQQDSGKRFAKSSVPVTIHNGTGCPPGYPMLPSAECALQFFKTALRDIEVLGSDEITRISVSKMRKVVSDWPQRLGLFVLSKHIDHRASWKHLSGQSSLFWSTKPFHSFMSRHADIIATSLGPGESAYFVVNGFDEPAVVGECVNMTDLAAQHPNVGSGLIHADEGVPIWSMSKVRGCHADLLIPHPDLFAKFSRAAEMTSSRKISWSRRKDKVVFRGSTTGMGDAKTNLRVKVIRELIDNPDFDVGLHAAIQTIQEDAILDLMKPKLSVAEWSSYRYAMDIDGNAHSFNRPLAIARAGCTMLRVNVFTDLFDDGLLSGTHAFDITPINVSRTAKQVLENLREVPDQARTAARLLTATHEWLTADVLLAYMQKAVSLYVISVEFVEK